VAPLPQTEILDDPLAGSSGLLSPRPARSIRRAPGLLSPRSARPNGRAAGGYFFPQSVRGLPGGTTLGITW
jgi:hypothetical protein